MYRYFVSQSSVFSRHNPLKGTTTSITNGKRMFHYQLSPETYPLVHAAEIREPQNLQYTYLHNDITDPTVVKNGNLIVDTNRHEKVISVLIPLKHQRSGR
jgi:hypothetical protein